MKKIIYSFVAASALMFTGAASATSTTTNISNTGSQTFSINVVDTLFNASFDGLGISAVTLSGPANYSFTQNFITDTWEFNTTNFAPGLYNLNVTALGAWTGQYTTTLGTFIPAAPVPEPETNMMMLFGLLAVAVAFGKTKSA
ncbi:PEP-CTERM sorting domain-containing protein [Methylophilus sp. 13]|uniref:PEP-CTERM sorting domain-containing protein n=1 Tax=Methylophilus sp. 13 TaxID=2781018 RepID=UPI00188F5DCD|nr:PEP-CTERM sorting domain-containing protein [Methylophilus sp. 13]